MKYRMWPTPITAHCAHYAPKDSRFLVYGLTHVECFRFLRLFKMIAAPKPAARRRLQQATTSFWPRSAMYMYTRIQVRSHCSRQFNGVHGCEQVFWLASMIDFGWSDTITTLSRTHASLRLASEQVSSRFWAGLGPDSIMNFGLKRGIIKNVECCMDIFYHGYCTQS